MYIELEALPSDEVEINISLLAHIAADWWCDDKSGCPDFLDHLTLILPQEIGHLAKRAFYGLNHPRDTHPFKG